jgi:hypothetical protein
VDTGAYQAMAHDIHGDFCARLDWGAFGNRLHDILSSANASTLPSMPPQ